MYFLSKACRSDTNTNKLNKQGQRQSQWWCSQPKNKMQKLLEKFIGRTGFCNGCLSEIAILHLAKCPTEIIISQTIVVISFIFLLLLTLFSPVSWSAPEIYFRFSLHIAVFQDNYQKSTNWPFFIRFSVLKKMLIDAWMAIYASFFSAPLQNRMGNNFESE